MWDAALWAAPPAALLLAALIWDAAVGYPDALYRRIGHPVTWIGALITRGDRMLNRDGARPALRRVLGILFIAGLVGLCGGEVGVLAAGLKGLPFGWVGDMLIAASLLAGRSLYDHVRAVARALRRDGPGGGRAAVARIVGRDVRALDETGICRAAIESLAENFSDGVIAPALAYLAFGLPGIAVYKAVNTADSMIGHRDDRYRHFGWAAARLDDGLNLLPARLTALLLGLAAGRRCAQALAAAWRYAGAHRSPNAGWPEAAMAGALDLRLGGPRAYGDMAVAGAWLGDGRTAATPDDIDRALGLYRRAMLLFAAMVAGVLLAA